MKNKFLYTITILMCLFIGSVGTIFVQNQLQTKQEPTVTNINYSETNSLSGSISKIYDSVVLVENYKNNKLVSSGTGFVYKKNESVAYIMTNHHVISDSTDIRVVMSNGMEITSKVVGSDEYADIAVLSIDSSNVTTVAQIGDSTSLSLGDTLFTVGSPLGVDYQNTITKGILSGKDREVTVKLSNGDFVLNVLQTDAAINEGNSGGPLCDVDGKVIGINSMKIVTTSTEGMGFAIPIEIAYSTAEKLETGEAIKRPAIGISLVNIDNYALYKYNITISSNITCGAVVIQVQTDSIAEKAGLKKGDVIIAVDNTTVKDSSYFRYLLYKHNIGDSINIRYIRNGESKDLTLNLTETLEG